MLRTPGNDHVPRRRPGRAQGDDGAALVEFALVMPVLFLLLFGIVEFGINLNDYQAIRQGIRRRGASGRGCRLRHRELCARERDGGRQFGRCAVHGA